MEYYKPTKREAAPLSPLLRLVLSAALGLCGGLGIPVPPLLLLLPSLFASVYVGWGRRYLLATAIAWAAVCFAALPLLRAACLAAAVLLLSLLLGELLYRKCPYRYLAVLMSAMLTAILYAAVCLPGILSGAGPYAAAQQYGEQIASRMTALAQTAYQDGAAAAQIMQESFDLLIQAIPSTLVGLLIFCSMAAGGCNVLLARALAKSAGAQLRPMAPFKAWRLDKSFLGGVAVLAVGALVLWLMDLSYSAAVISAIQVVGLVPLMLNGACTVEFILSVQPELAGRRRPVVVLGTVLLFPASMIIAVIVGVMDLSFGLRKRMPPNSSDVF